MFGLRLLNGFAAFLVAVAADAQAPTGAFTWAKSLDEARTTAQASGRLVLVHFWTPSCGPCKALDQNVFSQPQVADAIGQSVVPVKINANEAPELAKQLGVTRVPTDVLMTPDGKPVDRFISPPTAMDYVGRVTQSATTYRTQSGAAFAQAADQSPYSNAIRPSGVVNNAYAQLNVPAAGDRYAQAPVSTVNPYLPANQASAAQGATSAVGPVSAPMSMQPQAPQTGMTSNAYAMQGAPQGAPGSVPPQAQQNPPQTTFNPAAMNLAAMGQPAMNPAMANPAMPTQQPAVQTPPSQVAQQTPAGLVGQPQQAPVGQQQQPAAPAAVAVQLPPNSPPLGFDGFCPVTMKKDWKWVAGDVRWGAIHRGRTYLFAGQAQRDEFLTNPDSYSPVLSGVDPVLAVDEGQAVPGIRKHALEYGGQFYWFSSEETLNRFWGNAPKYSQDVRQAMSGADQRIVR